MRQRSDYRNLVKKSFKLTSNHLFADICFTQGPHSRLGITVTRRYGLAHERNYFKRKVREAFRLSCSDTNFFFDIIIRPRASAIDVSLDDIKSEIIYFVNRAQFLDQGHDDTRRAGET